MPKGTYQRRDYKALLQEAKSENDDLARANAMLYERITELSKPSPLPLVLGHVIAVGAYVSVHIMPLAGNDVKITISSEKEGEQYVYLSNYQRQALCNLLLSIS